MIAAMKFDADILSSLICRGVPEARVLIEDIRGDGLHLSVAVESPAFRGLSLVQQHQMVYAALQGYAHVWAPNMTLYTAMPQEMSRAVSSTGTGGRW